MNEAKKKAAAALVRRLEVLAAYVSATADGDAYSERQLRNSCTNRQYVGPQLEVGRDELAVLLDDDDDEDEERIDLAAEAAGE